MSERIRRHLLSQLLCLGRHTVTGVLTTSGRLNKDWTAEYRMYSSQRVKPEELFAPVRRSLSARLDPGEPLVAAMDDTRLRKTGRKIPGAKYVRDPLGPPFNVNLIWAQRFIQVSAAAHTENGMVRMVPVDFVHAPAPCKPRKGATEEDWKAFREAKREMALPRKGAECMGNLRKKMDDDGEYDRMLWASVDGGYTNGTFFKNIPERTEAIGRIRSDAKLYYLPESSEGKPGRNRVYGERAPTPEELRQDDSVPWQRIEAFAAGKVHSFKIKTISPLRWRPAGQKHDLRLIVIAPLGYRLRKGSKLLYRKPAFIVCTDPDAPIEKVLQAYLWRWDIEVNFRDEKTLIGVGEAQVRDENSAENVPALAVAAYAMLLASAIQSYGLSGQPCSLPPPKWRKKKTLRASTQSLLNQLRHEAWSGALRFSGFASTSSGDSKPEKLENSLGSALFYTTA